MGRKARIYWPLLETAYTINENNSVKIPITIIKVGKLFVSFVISINTPSPIKKDTPATALITVVIRLVSKFTLIAQHRVTNEKINAEPIVE